MASNMARLTNWPPKRSASVTTPTGSEVQAVMQRCTSSRSASERRHRCLWRERSSQMSSEEPPPMSNTSAKSQAKSISEAQPETASLASVSRSTIWMSRPGLGARALQELEPVVGKPAGLGGDQARSHHAVALDLGGAHLQRLDGALDGRFRQLAACRHALAQADDARERVDDLEAAPRRAGHQQPAIVGAEIERGVGGLRRLARGRRRERWIDRRRRSRRAETRRAPRPRTRWAHPALGFPHTPCPRRAARPRAPGPFGPPPSSPAPDFSCAVERHSV